MTTGRCGDGVPWLQHHQQHPPAGMGPGSWCV